jgi:hypothetical protein
LELSFTHTIGKRDLDKQSPPIKVWHVDLPQNWIRDLTGTGKTSQTTDMKITSSSSTFLSWQLAFFNFVPAAEF